MSIFHVIHVISRDYMLLYSIIIDIFSSPSEPISPYLVCCGGFAVDDYSLTGRFLAAAATSARK
jgi:hypothetical protein